MNQAFYQKLYQRIGVLTPLQYDCGRLCEQACCQVKPDLPGMYLFPGEEVYYYGLAGFTITRSILPGYGEIALLNCEGHCDRDQRPLSCRIFPLAPVATATGFISRIDPRGRALCPLCDEDKDALKSAFVSAVDAAFATLGAEPDGAKFLQALSTQIDQYHLPFRKERG